MITDNKKPFFVYCNIFAVIGHLVSSIFMIILLVINGSVEYPLTQNYLKWDFQFNSTDSCPLGSREFDTETGRFCITPSTQAICYDNENCYFLDLGILVISFHLLSFLFQFFAALTDCFPICCYKYTEMIQNNKNPLRFIEYSISASIMLICIALINGVSDINLLISIGVLTSMCQLVGLIVEYLKNPILKWILHFTGWIQFFAAYSIIFFAFFASASGSDETKPPNFVYAIVFILFILYACFGFVQITELFCEFKCSEKCNSKDYRKNKCLIYCCPPLRKNNRCNPEYKELVYIILSLTAKLILGWMIFSNVLI